jgi:hypothetical protein
MKIQVVKQPTKCILDAICPYFLEMLLDIKPK